MTMKQKPIFEYLNYRDYLKDYYNDMKKKKPGFSFRTFARMAGLKGYSLLSLVINGKRNLSQKTTRHFVKALGLKGKEAAYFENLVLLNQSTTVTDSEFYFGKLSDLTADKKINQLEREAYDFFSNPYYAIIREMASLANFCETPSWISTSLNHKISEEDIVKALTSLLKLNLLKRDASGRLKPARGTLKTIPDSNSHAIIRFHLAVMAMARDSILKTKNDLRESITLTIPMTKHLVAEIKEKLRKYQEEIALLVNQKAQNFEDIYQVNMQLFPVTQCLGRKPHET